MKYRKLRIAFSAVCGIICLLLTVMWVRSYTKRDAIVYLYSNGAVTVYGSNGGTFYRSYRTLAGDEFANRLGWSFGTGEASHVSDHLQWSFFGPDTGIRIPYVALLTVSGTIAAIASIPWRLRFSLRTLLIGMTVLAALLGAVIWAAK